MEKIWIKLREEFCNELNANVGRIARRNVGTSSGSNIETSPGEKFRTSSSWNV